MRWKSCAHLPAQKTKANASRRVGLDLDVGGAPVIGRGAGAGYAIATRNVEGEMAAPRGPRRVRAALISAVSCGLAGPALTLAGRRHHPRDRGRGGRGSRDLAPLGRLIGEPDFGPVSMANLAFGEGALFGLGLAYGLMRRPPGAQEAPIGRA